MWVYIYKQEQEWQPWENTLLYMKFDWNLKDEVSGNNWTAVSNPSYTTLASWIQVLDCNTSGYVLTPSVAMNTALTLCCWMTGVENKATVVRCDATSWTRNFYQIDWSPSGWGWGWYYGSTYRWAYSGSTGQTRNYVVLTCGSNWINVYVNWTNVYTDSYTSFVWKTQQRWVAYDQHDRAKHYWQYSNLIIENRVWTASEILNYYNATKWDYWIS
jgi:hypothetical protein